MVNPKVMCRKHLLGEHVETHMFVGSIMKQKSMDGYYKNGLLEIHNLADRHEALADEMVRRGYNHNSPMGFATSLIEGKIDIEENLKVLRDRCEDCKKLQEAK